MNTYAARSVSGILTFDKPLKEILSEIKPGGAIKLLDPVAYVTDRQRRWYKGVALPWLAKHDENQESTYWWDDEVKRLCNGLALLKKDIYFMQGVDGQKIPIGRLTTSGVGKRNMTAFIEEILAMSVTKGWGISPPDKDLRKG
jgi:hypothetical protein